MLIQLYIIMKNIKVDSIIIDSTKDFPNHGIADKRFVILSYVTFYFLFINNCILEIK